MPDISTKLLDLLRGGGIRRRLLLWCLSVFGMALLVVVVAGYSYMESQIRQDAAALQSELAAVTSEQIRTFVRRKFERFSDNAAALSLYHLGDKEQKLLLGLLVKNDSSFTHASIINSEGLEVLKVSDRKVYFPADLIDQSKSTSFIKALKGENYISAVFTSSQSQPYVTLAIPLWGVAQSVAGVVSAEADLSFLWEALGKIRFGTAGYAYLVDGQGNLIAHKDAALVLKRMNLKQVDGVKKFLSNPTRADTSPASEGKGLTGNTVLVTYAPVAELGWAVILEEPVETALAKVKTLRHSAILFLVVGLFVGAFVIAWVSQKITRPIHELRESVATIGAGNLEHRANIKTGDEIEELATEFNKMTYALESSYATLEQKVEQRTKEISTLYSVTTAVNESLALKDILAAVIPMTTEIFEFENIRVFLFNDEGTELVLQASYALNPEHSTMVHALKRGEGIPGRVAATGEAMIFEDLETDPRYAEISATRASLHASLGFLAVFPIKTHTRIFGTILFGAKSPRTLSPDQTRLMTSMSEHLAVAVEKANLFREAEKKAQQLSVLNTIGGAVNQSLNLDAVLNAALSKMIETLNFDASWIYIVDPSREQLELRAFEGLDEQTVSWLGRPESAVSLNATILTTGERVILDAYGNENEHHQPGSPNGVGQLQFASTAGFPIKAKEKVIGVLHLANKVKRYSGQRRVAAYRVHRPGNWRRRG